MRLSEAEKLEFNDRLHEIATHFRALHTSPLWDVQTFTVEDILRELDRDQGRWLTESVARIVDVDPSDLVAIRKVVVEVPHATRPDAPVYVLFGARGVHKLHFVAKPHRRAA